MTNSAIPTLQVDYTVTATTSGFTIDVTDCNLDADLNVADFTVSNSSDGNEDISASFAKTSRTVLTHTGAALTQGHVLNAFRTTELARVQETIQLGSGVSSSILDNEVQRIYKLIAEKASTAFFAASGNTVTRSTNPPQSTNDAPAALGDEWHVYTSGDYGGSDTTTRFFVATDVTGDIDTFGWFEVTGQDGVDGNDGAAATVSVGTVTTLAAGASATVVNGGTVTTAVLNFGIPQGIKGDKGDPGGISTPSVLTDGANIPVNAALSNVFTVTLGGNRTLGNPSNLTAGQELLFVITQDETGNRTLGYGSAYKFPGGTEPTLTIAANAVDILRCYTDGTDVYCNFTGDYS